LPIAAILVLPSVAWAGQPFDAKAFQSCQAAGKAILVDMTAPWCPTCKQQRPIVEEIKERPDLIVCDVDFDTAKDVLKRFRVQYQSTLSSGVRRKSRARRARPIRRRSVRSSRRRYEVPANLALRYAAGALSTLSPCVLPILPIVLFDLTRRVSAIWHSFLRDALLRSVKTLLAADATRLAILCSCGGCEC
jgi:thioredoxin 1